MPLTGARGTRRVTRCPGLLCPLTTRLSTGLAAAAPRTGGRRLRRLVRHVPAVGPAAHTGLAATLPLTCRHARVRRVRRAGCPGHRGTHPRFPADRFESSVAHVSPSCLAPLPGLVSRPGRLGGRLGPPDRTAIRAASSCENAATAPAGKRQASLTGRRPKAAAMRGIRPQGVAPRRARVGASPVA